MVKLAGDGLALFVVTLLMLGLGWLAVASRFIIRHRRKCIGSDDWLMLVGTMLFTVTCGLIVQVCKHGAGYKASDLDPMDIAMGTKFYFIAQFLYVTSSVPIKLSICVALMRIAGVQRRFRYTLYAIAGLSIVASIIVIVVIANICHPAPAMWGEAEGECNFAMNSGIGYFLSAVSIVTDWALAILPAVMLYNVQLKRSIKVSVAGVLALGAFASTATIVRLRYLVLYDNAEEFMYGVGKIAVWSILEEGIGIFAGSLPMLRPLLRYLPFVSSTGYGSKEQTNTSGLNHRGLRSKRGDMQLSRINGGNKTSDTENGKTSDGDSGRHILKETEFTVTTESYQGPSQQWNHNGIKGQMYEGGSTGTH